MFHLQEPFLTPVVDGGIGIRQASVVRLSEEAVVQSPTGTRLQPGPVLAFDMSDAVLTATRRQRGLLVKVGHASRDGALLLSLLMRAGRHVAMCLADLGDPEVQACTSAYVREGQLPLLLRSGSTALVSTSRLSDASRSILNEARGCRATRTDEFAAAARQHLALLSDEGFLHEQGVDTVRIRTRTMLLHVPASFADGLGRHASQSATDRPTMH